MMQTKIDKKMCINLEKVAKIKSAPENSNSFSLLWISQSMSISDQSYNETIGDMQYMNSYKNRCGQFGFMYTFYISGLFNQTRKNDRGNMPLEFHINAVMCYCSLG